MKPVDLSVKSRLETVDRCSFHDVLWQADYSNGWAGVSSASLSMWSNFQQWAMATKHWLQYRRAVKEEISELRILPADLGYRPLAFHVQSFQTFHVGGEKCISQVSGIPVYLLAKNT